MFSRTLMCGNSAKFWNTSAIFRLRAGTGVTRWPPMWTSPSVGFSRPAMVRRSVVFPHPEGPTRTRSSPSRISMSMPSTASTSPKRLVACSSRIAGQSQSSSLAEISSSARVLSDSVNRFISSVAVRRISASVNVSPSGST